MRSWSGTDGGGCGGQWWVLLLVGVCSTACWGVTPKELTPPSPTPAPLDPQATTRTRLCSRARGPSPWGPSCRWGARGGGKDLNHGCMRGQQTALGFLVPVLQLGFAPRQWWVAALGLASVLIKHVSPASLPVPHPSGPGQARERPVPRLHGARHHQHHMRHQHPV